MLDIAVIGTPEFTLGFKLTGVTKTFEPDDRPERTFAELAKNDTLGVVIADETLFSMLPEHIQEELQDMVKPTFVVVSAKASQDNLRRMIRKSIGVDLWEK